MCKHAFTCSSQVLEPQKNSKAARCDPILRLTYAWHGSNMDPTSRTCPISAQQKAKIDLAINGSLPLNALSMPFSFPSQTWRALTLSHQHHTSRNLPYLPPLRALPTVPGWPASGTTMCKISIFKSYEEVFQKMQVKSSSTDFASRLLCGIDAVQPKLPWCRCCRAVKWKMHLESKRLRIWWWKWIATWNNSDHFGTGMNWEILVFRLCFLVADAWSVVLAKQTTASNENELRSLPTARKALSSMAIQ